jgi:hypothetical protein
MIRVALLRAALAVAIAVPPITATAQSEPMGAVANRQGLLAERMAKAACLAARGIDREDAFAQLREAYETFARVHAGLRGGGIESSPELQAAVAKADPAWSVARMIVATSLEGSAVETDALPMLDRASTEVADRMDSAARLTAGDTAEAAGPITQAFTRDVAARQRILSQRIVKEACLLGLAQGQDVETGRDRLNGTVALFEASLTALRDGMPEAGILPPPNLDVERRLDWVGQLWSGLEADLELVMIGGGLDPDRLASVARRSELILSEMEEAVRLYGG